MSDHIDQLISLIFAIRKLFHEQTLQKKEKSMSILQFITLHYIKERKPLMKDLADFLTITPPSATSLVNTLVETGKVKRLYDSGDRRSVRLEITLKGEKYLKECTQEMEKRMKKNLEVLNKIEQKNLADILSKIISANNK
jgi:DNA-binding MarR family transcriptional regulator